MERLRGPESARSFAGRGVSYQVMIVIMIDKPDQRPKAKTSPKSLGGGEEDLRLPLKSHGPPTKQLDN